MSKKRNSWFFSAIFTILIALLFYLIAKFFMNSVKNDRKIKKTNHKYKGTKIKEPYMI